MPRLEAQRFCEALGNRITDLPPIRARQGRREPGPDSHLRDAEDSGVEFDVEAEQNRRVDQDRAAAPGLGTANDLFAINHQGVRQLIEKADR